MKKGLIILWAIAATQLFTACGSDNAENGTENQAENMEVNFGIQGNVKGAGDLIVVLEALSSEGTIEIAKTTTNANGQFDLKGNIKGMGLYQLRIGYENKVIPLTLTPKDQIKVEADYATYDRLPKISGASWTKPLTAYMVLFNEFAQAQTELAKRTELSQEQQIQEFLRLRKPLDDFALKNMSNDPGNPVNMVLSTSLTPVMGFENWDPAYLDVLTKVSEAFNQEHPGSPIAKSMESQVQQIAAGYKEFQAYKQSSQATQAGGIAPEIALKNPEGKIIKLSSLRGKIVLIDFWASWCGPCRKENPNVVRLYNQYKNKGFTVYSVSLDKDAEAWKRAITSDNLSWPNHVSDLLHWDSPMPKLYGFNGIPYTVLLDKTGKIIGTNLRGPALEQKLKEILG